MVNYTLIVIILMDKNYAINYLNQIITVKVDRPMGSKHPQHDYYYPVNYGYIPNTKAPDGKEIDVYILGIFKPLTKYTGKCVAIVQRKDDQDDKLIIIPTDAKYNINYSDDEIKAIIQFQERFFESKITRK